MNKTRTTTFLLTLPQSTLETLRTLADSEGPTVTINSLIRDAIDNQYQLTSTVRTRTIYTTDEQRKAARKQKAKERNELIKSLLDAHRKEQNK